MICNLCGVEGDFGTRRYCGEDVALKRCANCRVYFKEWRKKPDSKAKEIEKRHEASLKRKSKKKASTRAWHDSDRGKEMDKATRKAEHSLEYQREWHKRPAGKAKIRRENKKKYTKMRNDPHLWLKEKIRLKVGFMMRKSMQEPQRTSGTMMTYTEFEDAADVMRHFSMQFIGGMTISNHGNGIDQWSVGHEIPQAYYNPNDVDDLKRCWKKVNLFPQWHRENLRSNVKLPCEDRLRELIAMGCGPRVLRDGVLSEEERSRLERLAVHGRVFE